MIICPNCNHQNPEGSIQCENCYTALPATYNCPNCGASIQQEATFCGQCGFNLQGRETELVTASNPFEDSNEDDALEEDLIPTVAVDANFEQSPWDIEEETATADSEIESTPTYSTLELSNEEVEELEDIAAVDSDSLFNEPEVESTSTYSGLELSNEEVEELEDIAAFDSDPLFNEPEIESISAYSPSESSNEDIEEVEELPDIAVVDSAPLFNEPEIESTPTYSTSDSNNEDIEELPDSLEETEDIESWISSVKEESALEEDTASQTAELSDSDEMSAAEFAVSEPETLEFVPASSESTEVAVSTVGAMDSAAIFADEVTTEQAKAVLLHIQTGTKIEIAPNLTLIRIGKPNNQTPPDIDVSSFPNSEIVSRVHADIFLENNSYFIEDRGSSNGTYINHVSLPVGNRHLLKDSDRICLGKGDLVTFIFQLV